MHFYRICDIPPIIFIEEILFLRVLNLFNLAFLLSISSFVLADWAQACIRNVPGLCKDPTCKIRRHRWNTRMSSQRPEARERKKLNSRNFELRKSEKLRKAAVLE